MKITLEHYTAMEKAIKEQFPQEAMNKIRANYAESGLTGKRFRWDILHETRFPNGVRSAAWICQNLYSYLNDEHIDTALRAITINS